MFLNFLFLGFTFLNLMFLDLNFLNFMFFNDLFYTIPENLWTLTAELKNVHCESSDPGVI